MHSSITDTLKSNEFHDLISDISETTIDSFLEEGILKDLPILGLFFKGKNLVSTIQDKLLTKKILFFLKQLNETSLDERISHITKIDNSKKYRITVGEKLLYIIDKCEDYEKAEIIGVIFKSFILDKITYDDFLRCTISINSLSTIDLKELMIKNSFIEAFIASKSNIYLNTGLVTFKLKSNLKRTDRAINTQDIDVIYILSDLGKLLQLLLREYYNI